MKSIIRACAAASLILISCGRSAANVTTIGAEPAADQSGSSSPPLNCLTEPEPVHDQSPDLTADFGCAAIAVSRYGSLDGPQPTRHFGDIMPCNAAGWADAPQADDSCSPWQMAGPLAEATGNLALTVGECSGSLLPLNTFASVHASNIAYTDSSYLLDVSALGDVVSEPALPSGAVVLAALGAALIGWSWRRRVLSRGKYP